LWLPLAANDTGTPARPDGSATAPVTLAGGG
jgi:hypothetical protein